MRKVSSPNGSTLTYQIDFIDGSRRMLTAPGSWHVTFGPTAPSAMRGAGLIRENSQERGWTLRFYESKDKKLRAVITNVTSFRDTRITISELD